MAGPAKLAAAVPVSTKMPAPITEPMPRVVRLKAPRPRLSEFLPSSLACANSTSSGFLVKSPMRPSAPSPAKSLECLRNRSERRYEGPA